MGVPQENPIFSLSPPDHPLSKRRRFTPGTLSSPLTPTSSDGTSLSHHVFDSPLLQHSGLSSPSPLPHEIQADLLQVGMRIRKAVPEGYKTQRFTPRPFFNMRRLSPETQAAITGSPEPPQTSSTPELSPYAASRIHHVGGLAMQPISVATFCGVNLAALPPGFTESTPSPDASGNHYIRPGASTQGLWAYSTSHKRTHALDDSDDSDQYDSWSPATPTLTASTATHMPIIDDYFAMSAENDSDMENSMCDVSPLTTFQSHRRQNSFPFKQTRAPELNTLNSSNARKLAKPKSRLRNAPAAPAAAMSFNPFAAITLDMGMSMSMIPEQEPAPFTAGGSGGGGMLSCGMEMHLMQQHQHVQVQHVDPGLGGNAHDFSDATFLQRREDVEMDCS